MNQLSHSFSYSGGCHCQKIRFRLRLTEPLESFEVLACNCSMCEKFGYLHIMVPKSQLDLQCDFNDLENYQFNQKVARHYFCKSCGVKSFYQPRSHPDCWSVNARCLDIFSEAKLKISPFDGKNWEDNINSLK